MGGVGEEDEAEGGREAGGEEVLDEGDAGDVDEEDGVLRVFDDVAQLQGWHAGVDGVEDGADAGDGEVELDVCRWELKATRGDDVEPMRTPRVVDEGVGEALRRGV